MQKVLLQIFAHQIVLFLFLESAYEQIFIYSTSFLIRIIRNIETIKAHLKIAYYYLKLPYSFTCINQN